MFERFYAQCNSRHISYIKVGGFLFEIYNSKFLFDDTYLHVSIQKLLRRAFMKTPVNLKCDSLSSRSCQSNLQRL